MVKIPESSGIFFQGLGILGPVKIGRFWAGSGRLRSARGLLAPLLGRGPKFWSKFWSNFEGHFFGPKWVKKVPPLVGLSAKGKIWGPWLSGGFTLWVSGENFRRRFRDTKIYQTSDFGLKAKIVGLGPKLALGLV